MTTSQQPSPDPSLDGARLHSPAVLVPSASMFAYPTRLGDAWNPQMLRLHLPPYELAAHDVFLPVQQEVTQSLALAPGRWFKRFVSSLRPKLIRQDVSLYDARYDADGNVAHILTNIAPPVLAAQRHYPDLTVILRARASSMAQRAYELLGIPFICTDQVVQGRMSALPCGSHSYYGGLYPSIFRDRAFDGYQEKTPERIFIARKGSRRLLNEADVEAALQSYGFQKFYFEDIPIAQQWSLVRNAHVVVATHGAAMAGLVFNQRSAKVVELFHPGYVVNQYRTITGVIGGQWCGVMGQLPSGIIQALDIDEDARRFAMDPVRIDLGSLEEALATLAVER